MEQVSYELVAHKKDNECHLIRVPLQATDFDQAVVEARTHGWEKNLICKKCGQIATINEIKPATSTKVA